MSSPDNAPPPESHDGDAADDEAAQQALAAALEARGSGADAEDDNEDDGEEQFDADRARKKIDKANREAKSLRERIKALEPLAQEAEKRRKGEMTEAQKLAEEKAAIEVELAELRTTITRREAAETAGLPAEFVEFITAAEPQEALAQAKKLAKAVKAADQPTGSPDFRQGSRGANNSGSTQSADDLLRQMARPR
jgi:hypothetical protein